MEIVCKTYKESVYCIIDELDSYGLTKSVFSSNDTNNRAKIYGGKDCREISPMVIIIQNPLDMFPIISGRGNHFVMQLAELIWIYAGKNTLGDFFGQFASDTVKEFSHHTDVLYGGFGPRIRNEKLDQIKFVIDLLSNNNGTRSAMIGIYDPTLDSYVNGEHKPCATTINFQVIDGKIDCFVTLRANDLIKGYTAINYIEFAFLHSIIAYCLDMDIGRFINYTNTMHYYTGKAKDRIENIKRFKQQSIAVPDETINLNDLFDYSIPIENRYEKVISDIDSIYIQLGTSNTIIPNINMNNPIFGYIYKILGGIKNKKDLIDIINGLPDFLILPLLESQYKTRNEEIDQIVSNKYTHLKEVISWRNNV